MKVLEVKTNTRGNVNFALWEIILAHGDLMTMMYNGSDTDDIRSYELGIMAHICCISHKGCSRRIGTI